MSSVYYQSDTNEQWLLGTFYGLHKYLNVH